MENSGNSKMGKEKTDEQELMELNSSLPVKSDEDELAELNGSLKKKGSESSTTTATPVSSGQVESESKSTSKTEPYYSFIAPKPAEASTTFVAPVPISPKGTAGKGVTPNRKPTEFKTEPQIGEIVPSEASTTGMGQKFIPNAIAPTTIADARKEGKKPTYENYLETKHKQEVIPQGEDYVSSKVAGVYGGVRETATALEDFAGVNPDTPLLPEPSKGVLTENPEYKSFAEKKVGNVLDAVKGTATAIFDAAMLTPSGALFSAGVELAPKPITDFVLAPADDIASKLGYVPKEGSLGRKFLNVGNIAGSIAMLHGATKLGGKLMKNEPLTAEEVPQVKEIIDKATPNDLLTTFNSPEFQKYFHPLNFHENGVVNIVEKMHEGEDVSKDIARLDVKPEVVDKVLKTAVDAKVISEDKLQALRQKFADISKAKESVPEEHQNKPAVIALVAEKNALLDKKAGTDKVFHDAINEEIDKIDEKIKAKLPETEADKELAKEEAVGKTSVEPKPTEDKVNPSVVASETKTDKQIENRLTEIQDSNPPFDSPEQKEFNSLEKEMEKRERESVFNVPISEASKAIDNLIKKEKEQPNGWGSFIDKQDASESKYVIEKYSNPNEISDNNIKADFKEALMGKPATWYADGLKLRESIKEATKRGIDVNDLLKEVEKEFTKDGYDKQTAKEVIAGYLDPLLKGAKEIKPSEPLTKGKTPSVVASEPKGLPPIERHTDVYHEFNDKNIKVSRVGKSDFKEHIEELEKNTGEKVVRTILPIDKLSSTESEDLGSLSKYKKEIRDGVQTPIVVEYDNGQYYIINGHHRVEAYHQLGYKEIPVIVNESGKKDYTPHPDEYLTEKKIGDVHYGIIRTNNDNFALYKDGEKVSEHKDMPEAKKAVESLTKGKTPTTETKPTEVSPMKETPSPESESLSSIVDKYDNGENYTIEDMVNDVEALPIEHLSEKLSHAVMKFRKEQEYDRSVSGRGDMDAAGDAFESLVRKEANKGVSKEKQAKSEPKKEYDFSKFTKKELLDKLTGSETISKEELSSIKQELKARFPLKEEGAPEGISPSKNKNVSLPNERPTKSPKPAGAKNNPQDSGVDKGEKAKRVRAGNRVPKARREIKNPRALEALKVEPSTPREAVLQYFINKGQIHSDAIQSLYGNKKGKSIKGETTSRIGLINNKTGLGIDAIAHKLWEERTDERLTSSDYREAVEQVINDHVGTGKMIDELLNEKQPSKDEFDMYNASHEPEIVDEAAHYYDSLSEAEKQKMNEAETPPSDFDKTHNEFEASTPLEKAKKKLDKSREASRKATGLGINGQLHALPEFIEVVKDAIAVGYHTAKEFYDALKDEFPHHTEEEVKAAFDAVNKKEVFSTKNEVVKEKAKQNGFSKELDEATKTASRDFGSVWEEAQKDIDSKKVNPETLRNNLADGKGIPEGMHYDTANAILLNDQIALENTRDKATEAINKGDLSQDAINDLQVEREKATQALYQNYLASTKIGTELGRGLNARRMMADKEYSLTNIQNEMMAQQDGKPLTPDQKAWTEDMAKDIEAKAKKWDDFQKGAYGEEAISAIKDYIAKNGKGKTYTQRAKSAADTFRKLKTKKFEFTDENGNVIDVSTHGITWNDAVEAGAKVIESVGKVADAVAAAVVKLKEADWYKKLSDKDKARFEEQLKAHYEDLQKESEPHTEGELKIPHSVIRSLVEGGVDNINDLVNELRSALPEETGGKTDREIRDAVTDYGKKINMNPDDIEREIRKMKRIGKVISGLEDVAEKKRPLKSGLQRDKIEADERAKHKELKEAIKDLPMDEADLEKHYKTQLEITKNRLKNRIEDLQREIDTKVKANKSAKRVEADDELKSLREKKDALQEQHDQIFKDEAFKQKQRLEAYKQRSERKITELENRLAKGDFATKAKPSPIEHDKESLKIQAELQDAKDNFQQGKEALRLEQRGWGQKGIDAFLRVYREGLLSRVTTLGKLAMFGLTRQMAIRPLLNVAGQLARVIPKFNEIAKVAPTEGGMNFAALAENYKTFGNKEAYQQAGKKLGKLGKSDLDKVYGEHQFNYGELPFITTKSHGAIKHVPLQAEMNYAKKAMTDWMVKNSKADVNNPAVRDFISKYAYAKGMDAIYMGESKFLRQYQMNIRMWEQQGGNKYALAKLAKFMFPIIKVPYNFTKDVMIKQTPIGITDAAIKAYKADISKLTPKEADAIMMAMKKGMTGTAMILLGGYLSQKALGGLYVGDDAKKQQAIKAGEIVIGDYVIPHWMTHNALAEVAQMGATVTRLFKDAPESNGTSAQITEAFVKSVFLAGTAEAGNIPFYGELKDIAEASGTWSKTKKVAGQKVASIVPGIIQEAANKLDTRNEAGQRQEGFHPFSETRKVGVEGFVNPVKAAIPFLRNTMERPKKEIEAQQKHGKPMSEKEKIRSKKSRDNKFSKLSAKYANK